MSHHHESIVINPPFAPQGAGSWWLDLDRAAFTEMVRRRTAELSPRFGSMPVATMGERDPGFNETGAESAR